MRRFNAAIADSISAALKKLAGTIVAEAATLKLRTYLGACAFLARLTGRITAATQVVVTPCLRGVDAGGARTLDHLVTGALWSRPSWRPVMPGSASHVRSS